MSEGERASMEREAKDKASKGMLLVGSTMLLSLAAAIGHDRVVITSRRCKAASSGTSS